MSFDIVLTETAKHDVRSIVGWIQERSRTGSEIWFHRWLDVLDSLKLSADSCGLAPEDDDHDADIRQVVFKTRRGKPYRALFIIDGTRVIVLHVRGSGQDLIEPEALQLPW